jgi:hypothetical protein
LECGELFKKILVPLPSEYFPEIAIKRAVDLASKFGSKLYLLYVYEEYEMEKILTRGTSHALTEHDINKIECMLIEKEMNGESEVYFKKIEQIAKPKKLKFHKFTCKGLFSEEILKNIKSEKIDLIVSEFREDVLLKYSIFYDSPIPVWIERTGENIENIYGICTNLAKNKKVPKYTINLAEKFGSNVRFNYVFDEEKAEASQTQIDIAKRFLNGLEKKYKSGVENFKTYFFTQDVLKYLLTSFKIARSDLVILGRFEKKGSVMFQTVDKKVKVCQKIPVNVLILK